MNMFPLFPLHVKLWIWITVFIGGTMSAENKTIYDWLGPAYDASLFNGNRFAALDFKIMDWFQWADGKYFTEEEGHRLHYTHMIKERRGDAFASNSLKLFHNLVDIIKKFNGTWKAPKTLTLDDNPFYFLRESCSIPPLDIDENQPDEGMFVDWVHGKLTVDDLFALDDKFYENNCYLRGEVPLLECIVDEDWIKGDDNWFIGECQCIIEDDFLKWLPYVYEESETANGALTCKGAVGAICNKNVGCLDGLECVDGHCGGTLGLKSRGFGGTVRFTDERLVEVMRRKHYETKEEAEKYIIETSNSVDLIGKNCDLEFWNWAVGMLLPVLVKVNSSSHGYIRDIHYLLSRKRYEIFMEYYRASAVKHSGDGELWHRERIRDPTVWSYINRQADYYDIAQGCLNEFPRMSCLPSAHDPGRGRCKCANFSAVFAYFEEDGQCVGMEGSVCTTVRGSGDFACAKGLVCEQFMSDQRHKVPDPLSHWEIRICRKPIIIFKNSTQTRPKPKSDHPSRISLTPLQILLFAIFSAKFF